MRPAPPRATANAGFSDVPSVARLSSPSGIWDSYVADTGNATVRSVSQMLATVAGEVSHIGAGPAAPYMHLAFPSAIASDSEGNLVFSQAESAMIRVGPQGNVSTLGNHDARAIALDGRGNAYFTDNRGLGKLDMSSLELARFDVREPSGQYGDLVHDGGDALYVSVHPSPQSIAKCYVWAVDTSWHVKVCGKLAVDGTRRLFVAQRLDRPSELSEGRPSDSPPETQIFAVDIETRVVTPLASPADGWRATAMAYHPSGFLYVAEGSRQRIRGLSVDSGEIVDVAGKLGSQGVQLGPLPASLSYPIDVAVLPSGALAVADYNENVIVVAK
jgi:hypothetical protein